MMDLFAHAAHYPHHAGYKEHGGTSQEAAEKTDAKKLRAIVLRELTRRAGTADELAERLGLSILSVRPRVSELVRLGKAVKTGQRRRNASGHSAAVVAVAQ
jgi:predicted HTH transcriptional regulator